MSSAEEATELVRPSDQPDKDWPVYGVNNKAGVFFSHYQKGSEFNSAYKRIRADWFFHNPTRANVGSLGRVPQVPEDAITSPEYQVWRIRNGCCLILWRCYCGLGSFWTLWTFTAWVPLNSGCSSRT